MDTHIINAPAAFANSALNGTRCLITFQYPGTSTVEVLLLDGPHACRFWQVLREHVAAA